MDERYQLARRELLVVRCVECDVVIRRLVSREDLLAEQRADWEWTLEGRMSCPRDVFGNHTPDIEV